MKVYTRKDKTWGLLRTDSPPKATMAFCTVVFILSCIGAVSLLFYGIPFWGCLVVVAAASPMLLIKRGAYRAWEKFYNEMRQKEEEEAARAKAKENAYKKAHEDDLFYQECEKAGICADTAAGVARMKLIAKQMDITCSDEELLLKYHQGQAITKKERQTAAEKERLARIPILRKEEQAAEKECKKYINLQGNEKRVQDCLNLVAEARAKVARYSGAADTFEKGGKVLYDTYAKKESDWAVHGGVASAIAGPAAGVAVAMDIQQKNAEAREYNDNLSQSIGKFTAEMQVNAWMNQSKAEEVLARREKEAEEAKLKLVEPKPQEELLALITPKITKTERSETGAITFEVSTQSATLTIYDTVKATVDGFFKVQIMDGDKLVGEAYFTLPYQGSYRSNKLTSICASLPSDDKKYSFVFAPYNLFAIEL